MWREDEPGSAVLTYCCHSSRPSAQHQQCTEGIHGHLLGFRSGSAQLYLWSLSKDTALSSHTICSAVPPHTFCPASICRSENTGQLFYELANTNHPGTARTRPLKAITSARGQELLRAQRLQVVSKLIKSYLNKSNFGHMVSKICSKHYVGAHNLKFGARAP